MEDFLYYFAVLDIFLRQVSILLKNHFLNDLVICEKNTFPVKIFNFQMLKVFSQKFHSEPENCIFLQQNILIIQNCQTI